MKAYHITGPTGLDALTPVDIPEPDAPGPGQVLVDMRAWSLNYRDLAMPHGGYIRNDKAKTDPPLVPLSDGAGTVLAVGPGVTTVAPGDRVATCFFQDWEDGDLTEEMMWTALGGAIDGCLAEKVLLSERGLIPIPDSLTDAQAATLPCAAVTAWQALHRDQLSPGQTVLCLGTGGVSIFALQLAKAHGARVIITSSSDAKLERARDLGADHTINYREHPDWHQPVRAATDGVGVDNIIEVGGAGTLERSLQAVRVSGTISLIGILAQPGKAPSILPALFNRITVRGIYVGSRQNFRELLAAVTANAITPVISDTFPFDDTRAAFDALAAANHFGKIVITR